MLIHGPYPLPRLSSTTPAVLIHFLSKFPPHTKPSFTSPISSRHSYTVLIHCPDKLHHAHTQSSFTVYISLQQSHTQSSFTSCLSFQHFHSQSSCTSSLRSSLFIHITFLRQGPIHIPIAFVWPFPSRRSPLLPLMLLFRQRFGVCPKGHGTVSVLCFVFIRVWCYCPLSLLAFYLASLSALLYLFSSSPVLTLQPIIFLSYFPT